MQILKRIDPQKALRYSTFAAAGLFAHSVFLSFLLRDRWQEGLPLATWYAGCLTLVLGIL